jgi:group I intron endonuclease
MSRSKGILNMTNIYLITNRAVTPNMYYIGRTNKELEKRFEEHIRLASRKNNKLLHEAILEYGKRNFTIELLEKVDECIASEIEEKYIKQFNSHFKDGFGYNMRYENVDQNKHYYGADLRIVEENISKGAAWNKGVPVSETTRKKVSETKKHRHKNGLYKKYGHKHSEETKAKLSEIAKKRPAPTKETRDKLSEKSSGRKCYYNPELRKRVFLKNDEEIPSGYLKGKGTAWVSDGKTEVSVDLWEKEKYIRNGYSEGRLVYVGKNS